MSGFENFSAAELKSLISPLSRQLAASLRDLFVKADTETLKITSGILTTINLTDEERKFGFAAGKPIWVKRVNTDGNLEIDIGEFLKDSITKIQYRKSSDESANIKKIFAIIKCFNAENLLDIAKASNLLDNNLDLDLIKALQGFDEEYTKVITSVSDMAAPVQPAYMGADELTVAQKQELERAKREQRNETIIDAAKTAFGPLLRNQDVLPEPAVTTEPRSLIKAMSRTASKFSMGARTLSFSRSASKLDTIDTLKDELSENVAAYRKQLATMFILHPQQMYVLINEKSERLLIGPKLRELIRAMENGDKSDPENPIPGFPIDKKTGERIVPEEIKPFYDNLKKLADMRADVEDSIDAILKDPEQRKKTDDFTKALLANERERMDLTLKALTISAGVKRASIAIARSANTKARSSIAVAKEQGEYYDDVMDAISEKIAGYYYHNYKSKDDDRLSAEDKQLVRDGDRLIDLIQRKFVLTFKSGTITSAQRDALVDAINNKQIDLLTVSNTGEFADRVSNTEENVRRIFAAINEVFETVKPRNRAVPPAI